MGYGRVGRPKNSEKVYRPTPEAIEAERAMRKACRFYQYFPDTGPLRRELYAKHVAFMNAGREWKQRSFLAANRSGKSDVAAYEITCHLTGHYPPWWQGRVFTEPGEWWAAGDTAGTTRDIIQVAFLGPTSTIETKDWCGMLPRTMVHDVARKPGVPLAVSTIWVRHKNGGMSSLDLKSFDQKRESFQGTAKAGVWLDEECPEDIYSECLMRTMTTDGLMMVTFTPLQGLTPFIASWLERSMVEVLDDYGRSQLRPAKSEVFKGIESADMPDESDFSQVAAPKEEKGTRYIVMATWDDAPHLSEEQKEAMILEFPPHQRDARSKGIPALGSGVIYPIPESELKVQPFEIPASYARCFGMDIDAGAGWTAAIWLAHDKSANVFYLYDVYKRSHAEPVVHATAIKARGAWIPGVADAAALLVTAHDSEQMLSVYRKLGLKVVLPDKSTEAGIFDVWSLMSSGRLKVFASCGTFFEEFRLYRRDGKGRIVKQNDHVMDCCVVGETPVWTGNGPVPIQELVGQDGWCVSRDGAMVRFMGARKVFENVPVVKVSFADGSDVTCTPDHPFLTPNGWIRADHMRGELCYNGISQRIQLKGRSECLNSRVAPTKSSRASDTTPADSTISVMGDAFIAPCGSHYMARSLAGSPSIISMETDPTTALAISTLLSEAPIPHFTKKATNEDGQPMRVLERLNGIGVRPDENGIENTVRSSKIDCSAGKSSSVKSAARLRWAFQTILDSVQQSAVLRSVVRLMWTTWNVAAWSVARCLRSIVTRRHHDADALVRAVSVVPWGQDDVYCLTVPGLSAFAVGSGVVVHNTRYAVRSGIAIMKTKPEDAETKDRSGISLEHRAQSWLQ